MMPKTYSQYKYEDVANLGLTLKQRVFLNNTAVSEASDFLRLTLDINTKRVLSTEKEKSEFVIAPILFEIARKNEDKISFFSGFGFLISNHSCIFLAIQSYIFNVFVKSSIEQCAEPLSSFGTISTTFSHVKASRIL